MSVREYIGARYIPLFSDPIEWDNTHSYEPLTVVINQGNSYVSKQFVPIGAELPAAGVQSNDYWLLWADYNAQIEQYRAEVATFSGRINANTAAIQALNGELTTEVGAREAADTAIREDFAADLAEEIASVNATISADVDRLETQDEKLGIHNYVTDFGADPTGQTDSTAAIQAAINATKGGTVIFAPGTYLVTSPLELPYNMADKVSIAGEGATIKAGAALDTILLVGTGDTDGQNQNDVGYTSFIKDLKLDAGTYAVAWAIDIITGFKDLRIDNVTTRHTVNGVRIGKAADNKGVRPADVYMSNCLIYCKGAEYTSIGLDCYCSDNKIVGVRVYGAQTGARIHSASYFELCHILLRFENQTTTNFYPYPPNGVDWNNYYPRTIGFELISSAQLIGCYVDTMHTGYKITAETPVIITQAFNCYPSPTELLDIDACIMDLSENSGNFHVTFTDSRITLPQSVTPSAPTNEVYGIKLPTASIGRYSELVLSGLQVQVSYALGNFDLLKGQVDGQRPSYNAASGTWYVFGAIPVINSANARNFKRIMFDFNSNICELWLNLNTTGTNVVRSNLEMKATSTSTTNYTFGLHPLTVDGKTVLLLCASTTQTNLNPTVIEVNGSGGKLRNYFTNATDKGESNISGILPELETLAGVTTPASVLPWGASA